MKNKTLIISLAVVTGLLILETGFLMGLNEARKIARMMAISRYRQPIYRPVAAVDAPNDMAAMQEKMSRIFDYSFSRALDMQQPIPVREQQGYSFNSSLSSKETDQVKTLTLNIPGLEKKDFDIGVKGRYLIIRLSRDKETNINKKDFRGEQASAMHMTQIIIIPDNARVKDITAAYNNGVLTVSVPKNKEAARPAASEIKVPVR